MEVMTAALLFCHTWPCFLAVALIAGGAAGAATGYLVVRGVKKN
jgi:ABC-type uncharacterized transport system permease subunit